MTAPGIRLYQTQEHPCGYWPDRLARDLLLDPHEPSLPALYEQVLALGFRRSGGNIYRPRCTACQACTPLRVPVAGFRPNRSQRRCIAANLDLQWSDSAACCTDERFELYGRYLQGRHPGGGMEAGSRDDFERFLLCDWAPTRFLEARLDGQLVAVAVTDALPQALSAVYTFFEPALSARSLGTAAVLQQIAWARASGREHLYLGFWLAGHPKMDYKARFCPAELLRGGRWVPATD
jgi:leucyl-tRNA---protein transferase